MSRQAAGPPGPSLVSPAPPSCYVDAVTPEGDGSAPCLGARAAWELGEASRNPTFVEQGAERLARPQPRVASAQAFALMRCRRGGDRLALTITQLVELRLRMRSRAGVTALIDRCLVLATAAEASAQPHPNAAEELARLSERLAAELRAQA